MRLEYLFAMSDYRYHLSQVDPKRGRVVEFEKFVRFHDDDAPEDDLMAVAKLIGAPVRVKKAR